MGTIRPPFSKRLSLSKRPTTRNDSPATSIVSPTDLPRFSAKTLPSIADLSSEASSVRPFRMRIPRKSRLPGSQPFNSALSTCASSNRIASRSEYPISRTPSIPLIFAASDASRLLVSLSLTPARTTTRSIPLAS